MSEAGIGPNDDSPSASPGVSCPPAAMSRWHFAGSGGGGAGAGGGGVDGSGAGGTAAASSGVTRASDDGGIPPPRKRKSRASKSEQAMQQVRTMCSVTSAFNSAAADAIGAPAYRPAPTPAAAARQPPSPQPSTPQPLSLQLHPPQPAASEPPPNVGAACIPQAVPEASVEESSCEVVSAVASTIDGLVPAPAMESAPVRPLAAEPAAPPSLPPSPSPAKAPAWLEDLVSDEQPPTSNSPFVLQLSPHLVQSPDRSGRRLAPASSWFDIGFDLGSRPTAPDLQELIGSSTMPQGPLPIHLQQILSGFESAQAQERGAPQP